MGCMCHGRDGGKIEGENKERVKGTDQEGRNRVF